MRQRQSIVETSAKKKWEGRLARAIKDYMVHYLTIWGLREVLLWGAAFKLQIEGTSGFIPIHGVRLTILGSRRV